MAHKSAGAADPEALPEVLQFMRLLWGVAHALDRTSKRMNQELGVTGPQRLVLRVVGLFPGLSAGALAHILHVHPSTLTGVLQRLIEQRLLARTTAQSDRRRAQLRLTGKGARINHVTDGTVEAAVGRVLRRSSARDRAAARRLFAALTEALAPPED
ncbi:MAG TPA: MarR family transcriptional regulator [Vicinamibacterales bacterium]|nr:MarR family transcriptional regulator [Vicinamibacterales bacterium]